MRDLFSAGLIGEPEVELDLDGSNWQLMLSGDIANALFQVGDKVGFPDDALNPGRDAVSAVSAASVELSC